MTVSTPDRKRTSKKSLQVVENPTDTQGKDSCYCVCHSPVSSRAMCEHCHGFNEVGVAHDVMVTMSARELEAQKQLWQLEARIDEVEHTVCKDNTFNYQKGSWEGMSKRARLDQLKSQLNNPPLT